MCSMRKGFLRGGGGGMFLLDEGGGGGGGEMFLLDESKVYVGGKSRMSIMDERGSERRVCERGIEKNCVG